MFHAKDGWFFRRNDDASVSVFHNPDNVPNCARGPEVTLSAEVWASVVSSVSREGEENGRFYAALDFHGLSEAPVPSMPSSR